MPTFLIECYVPAYSPEVLAWLLARVREAAAALRASGKHARLLGCIFLPQEETVFCLLEASSLEVVEELNLEAGMPADRIADAECVPLLRA
jgi:hypothetical protein